MTVILIVLYFLSAFLLVISAVFFAIDGRNATPSPLSIQWKGMVRNIRFYLLMFFAVITVLLFEYLKGLGQ